MSTKAFLVSYWLALPFLGIKSIGFSSLKVDILLAHTEDSSISLALFSLSINKQIFTSAILVLKIRCLLLTLGTLFFTAQVEIFTILPIFLLIFF